MNFGIVHPCCYLCTNMMLVHSHNMDYYFIWKSIHFGYVSIIMVQLKLQLLPLMCEVLFYICLLHAFQIMIRYQIGLMSILMSMLYTLQIFFLAFCHLQIVTLQQESWWSFRPIQIHYLIADGSIWIWFYFSSCTSLHLLSLLCTQDIISLSDELW
jgi:hypothetical protein